MGTINQILPSLRQIKPKEAVKKIALLQKGCRNRPFFHIDVIEITRLKGVSIEKLGNYDPLPNKYNEKIISINFERLQYWLKEGAIPTEPMAKLLGLCGYFPVHPQSFKEAWINRFKIRNRLNNLKEEVKKLQETDNSTNTESSSEENISPESSKT